MNRIIKDWIEDMPNLGDKFLACLAYIFGTPGGGLLFPVVYGVLLWRSWDAPRLTSGWHWIVVGLGILLSIASIFYPTALARYFRKMLTDVDQMSALLDIIREKHGRHEAILLGDLRAVHDALGRLLQKLQ